MRTLLLLILFTTIGYSQTKVSDTYVQSEFKHWLKNCSIGIEDKGNNFYVIHFYWNDPLVPCEGCPKVCWLRGESTMELLFRNGNKYVLRQASVDDCDRDVWAAFTLDIPNEISQKSGEMLFSFLHDIKNTPWAFISFNYFGIDTDRNYNKKYDLKPDSWSGINNTPERFFMDAIKMLDNE